MKLALGIGGAVALYLLYRYVTTGQIGFGGGDGATSTVSDLAGKAGGAGSKVADTASTVKGKAGGPVEAPRVNGTPTHYQLIFAAGADPNGQQRQKTAVPQANQAPVSRGTPVPRTHALPTINSRPPTSPVSAAPTTVLLGGGPNLSLVKP